LTDTTESITNKVIEKNEEETKIRQKMKSEEDELD